MKFKTPEIKELAKKIYSGEDLSESQLMEEILAQNLISPLTNVQLPHYYKLLYSSLLLDKIDVEIVESRQNFEKILFLHKEKQKILKEMEKIKLFLFPQ